MIRFCPMLSICRSFVFPLHILSDLYTCLSYAFYMSVVFFSPTHSMLIVRFCPMLSDLNRSSSYAFYIRFWLCLRLRSFHRASLESKLNYFVSCLTCHLNVFPHCSLCNNHPGMLYSCLPAADVFPLCFI